MKLLVSSLLAGVAMLSGCATSGGSAGTPSPSGGASGSSMPSGGGSGSSLPRDAGSAGSTGNTGNAGTSGRSGNAGGAAGSAHGDEGNPGDSTSSARGGQSGSADTGVPAKTPAERRADIDSRLDASLGRFDEQLRGEQQRAATERDARVASNGGGATGTDSAGTGRGDEILRDRSGDLRSDGAQTASSRGGGEQKSGSGPGTMSQGGGGGGVAAQPIPSGEDDDIVARRLRRAAEAETDPELKEKLWKEYRDYKENTRGRG